MAQQHCSWGQSALEAEHEQGAMAMALPPVLTTAAGRLSAPLAAVTSLLSLQ